MQSLGGELPFNVETVGTKQCDNCARDVSVQEVQFQDSTKRIEPEKCVECHVPDGYDSNNQSYKDTLRSTYRSKRDKSIPERYQQLLGGELKDPISRWMAQFGEMDAESHFFYLHGPRGCGKTTYICRAIDYLYRQQVIHEEQSTFTAIYTTESGIKNDMKAEFDGKHSSPQKVLNRLINADFLAIDELGNSNHTEWTIENLQHLIDNRYLRNSPTIFGSNFKLDDLAANETNAQTNQSSTFGAHIVDRIYEACGQGEYSLRLTGNIRRQ